MGYRMGGEISIASQHEKLSGFSLVFEQQTQTKTIAEGIWKNMMLAKGSSR
jgi:hypothetical protein